MLTNTNPCTSATWFPDLGASHHANYDAQHIQQHFLFAGPDQIIVGNSQGIHIQSAGSTHFLTPLNSIFIPSQKTVTCPFHY